MGTLRSLLRIPSGRRTKWVVLAVWLIIGLFAFSTANKLYNVEQNSADAYLPHSAQSTQVIDYLENAPGAPPTSDAAVVLYVNPAGLDAADAARVKADVAALQQSVPGLAGPVTTLPPSSDGKAVGVEVPVKVPITGRVAGKAYDYNPSLDAIKQVAQPQGQVQQGSLSVYVGGGYALNAAANGAFGGLDSKLLLGAGLVVVLILLLTYRSPFLWLMPLVSSLFALQLAQAIMYELVQHAGVVVSGQSGGILTVLVFGVGTDYALLLVARYREELHNYEDKHEAMRVALGRSSPAVVASALTVMLSTLGLLVSQLASNAGLGKIGAIGVACALLAMTTLLPALLVIVPRGVFWPAVPRYGEEAHARVGVWGRVAGLIKRGPRRVWVLTALLLAVLSLGLLDLHSGQIPIAQSFSNTPAAVVAQQQIDTHYPDSGTEPLQVLANASAGTQVAAILHADKGLAPNTPGGFVVSPLGARNLYTVAMAEAADSQAARETVIRLRAELGQVPGADALVAGTAAVNIDVQDSAAHDRDWVIPIVLAISFVILIILLQALIAPLLLLASVVLSFLAALGVAAFVSDQFFNRPTEDNSYPLFVFIFLVALGIDYNIFLMTRVREETLRIGTRPGILRGLTVTGGVITSAGFVLAATFAVLTTLPLTQFLQIGFAVAFGVLLDTLLVRTVLVPALCYDVGSPIWWPSQLARKEPEDKREYTTV
ncbi:MMPL family transporter [Actinospica robiniae]|uniref:MMPL family transporter n=1 Tax=Actinospica robiniae TaxID=304901 RepID=UPI0003F94E21|nr:MMPL family transporter [Actinospica robiniae]